jgi:hypothetical protein
MKQARPERTKQQDRTGKKGPVRMKLRTEQTRWDRTVRQTRHNEDSTTGQEMPIKLVNHFLDRYS